MDYVVGSISALVSGNVTPNRPRLVRKAATPTKRPHSPNVTPKSELVDDRSIFLSPSLQKKKAIVKKSPKRIFQNPDLDVTNDENGILSPKADKVKKHLKNELGSDITKSELTQSPSKKTKKRQEQEETEVNNAQEPEEVTQTPSKKKKSKKVPVDSQTPQSPSKKNKEVDIEETEPIDIQKSNNKRKSTADGDTATGENQLPEEPKSKKKKRNKKKNKSVAAAQESASEKENDEDSNNIEPEKIKSKKISVNPNAVTAQDTDSEHESDNEIESENEEHNNEVLNENNEPEDNSSDEETETKNVNKPKVVENEPKVDANEAKRTLFVGNVPFSKKCKKEIKKIFSKYGEIETVRIRTIPVKDGRVTPKLAIIRNELHPDRTTVNVYVKYANAESVDKALVENNTVLNNHHLRVSRSDHSGDDVDPKCAVFVGNVPFGIEDEALRAKFEKCGDINSVRIVRDKKTNAGKGFAFVNFATKDGVELALSLTEEDLTIKNRIMRVKRCSQMAKAQKRPGSKFDRKPQQGGKGFGHQKQVRHDPKGGAYQRIKNKKQMLESGSDGPPNKRQNMSQPQKQKKPRKEFVGVTSEKKKKRTFDKTQKKKKAISEILRKA